ncbi:hypothetical protein [Deferribacter abyssi]|uniref:hypothetical protein n=1 Tax=Deferribacter abyssi TaxID=213806 RepID=UPI003C260BEB
MNGFELKFKARLKKISEELNDIENFLRDNGIDIPNQNIPLKPDEKIRIPRRYIRTVHYFEQKYKLYDLLEDEVLVKNISYALQASDLFNYILNRFNIRLSVGKVFYKFAIINIFSIIESLLYGIANKCHSYCMVNNRVCKNNDSCNFYLKKANKYPFEKLLYTLSQKGLIRMPPELQNKLLKIKALRDNIHLWDVKNKDYFNDDYNLDNYNFLIKLLNILKKDLNKALENFEHNRNNNCNKR